MEAGKKAGSHPRFMDSLGPDILKSSAISTHLERTLAFILPAKENRVFSASLDMDQQTSGLSTRPKARQPAGLSGRVRKNPVTSKVKFGRKCK